MKSVAIDSVGFVIADAAITVDAYHCMTQMNEGVSMKYIFVTGGVVSSLGKGLTAGALGALLEQRGLCVRLQKFDPYLKHRPRNHESFPTR